MATATLDGRPVAVVATRNRDSHTIRTWDLTTCEQFGELLISPTDHVKEVVPTEVDGRPIVVGGS